MTSVLERPTTKEQKIAKEVLPSLGKINSSFGKKKEMVQVEVNDHQQVQLKLPVKVFKLLEVIVGLMAEGKSFSLIPGDAELSTQQAAEILKVSRPHLVKMLESGQLPHRKVGAHRRILCQDLMAFMTAAKAGREKALEELAKQSQKLDMGY